MGVISPAKSSAPQLEMQALVAWPEVSYVVELACRTSNDQLLPLS